ncbi:MAG: hypothetical protein JSV03_08945 [Planctomycetota bacterium]|nr:MAG: hypothetical protein JSV03_08945 [Planctomycetota bacterium]
MERRKLGIPWSPRTASFQTMQLTLSNPANDRMDIDMTTTGYRYIRKDGRIVEGPNGFGEQVLFNWLTDVGVDTSKKHMKDIVKHLVFAIDEAPRAKAKFTNMDVETEDKPKPGINAHPTNIYTRTRTPRWLVLPAVACWLLVWLIGVRRILAHHRRLKAAANLDNAS